MTKKQQALDLIHKVGTLCSKDLGKYQISPKFLHELHAEGSIIRVGRGIYTLAEPEQVTENYSFAIAAKRIPQGAICLLSALQFHELTTQDPYQVWVAIPYGNRTPKEKLIPLRIFRFSKNTFTLGLEKYLVGGISIPVYNIPKTIVDLFKFRNKVGLDVALEALKEGWRERRFQMDDVWNYAKICRVSNVMQPYLEMLS